MTNQFHRARRPKTKLRLSIAGQPGSGKTYGALQLAFGLGGRVALLDTEYGSGALYAQMGDYDICSLQMPLSPKKYLEAVLEAEASGYNVLIIDSLRHVGPEPGPVLEALMQSRCHIIVTMREPIDVSDICLEEMEYAFTAVLDIDRQHIAGACIDRTGLFDEQSLKLTPAVGRLLLTWLEAGGEESAEGSAKQPARQQTEPAAAGSGREETSTNTLTKAAPTGKKRLF